MTSNPLDGLAAEAALNEPKTPYEYVAAWFFNAGLTVNARQELSFETRRDNLTVTIMRIRNDYQIALRERRLLVKTYNESAPKNAAKLPAPQAFQVTEIDQAVALYLKDKSDEAFEALKTNVAYSEEAAASGELERLLETIKGVYSSLDVAVFKHIIWQVKQRMWNRKARHEMIVSFLGKQGAGKTTLIRQLAEPIKELFVERRMSDIVGDERNNFMLQKSYLMLFEELENASRVDIDSLKALTSKDATNWRILGKNIDDNGYMNTTFVCTSNKPIKQVFYDPTGMRRFYEFKVVDEIPRRKVNSIDFLKVWQSVDEEGECPIEGLIKELYEFQNVEYRNQSTVELFIEDCGYVAAEEGRAQLRDVYSDYKRYCEQYGFKSPVSAATLSNELINLGYSKGRSNKGIYFQIEKKSTNVLKLPKV